MEEKPEEFESAEPADDAAEMASDPAETASAEMDSDSELAGRLVYQAYLSEESSLADRLARILGSAGVALACIVFYVYLTMVEAGNRLVNRALIVVFFVAAIYFCKVTFFPGRGSYSTTHGTPKYVELENMSANGGAMGAMVLGIWTIIGALITPWSVINGAMGMALGLWGLASKKPKMAFLGILLSAAGAVLCALDISETVGSYFINTEEAEF